MTTVCPLKMNTNEHSAYMKSTAYLKLKCRALERAKFRCELCGEDPVLNVHHHDYKNLGNENHDDICILCTRCHGYAHRHNVTAAHLRGLLQKAKTKGYYIFTKRCTPTQPNPSIPIQPFEFVETKQE